jgi:hypothetical protein
VPHSNTAHARAPVCTQLHCVVSAAITVSGMPFPLVDLAAAWVCVAVMWLVVLPGFAICGTVVSDICMSPVSCLLKLCSAAVGIESGPRWRW